MSSEFVLEKPGQHQEEGTGSSTCLPWEVAFHHDAWPLDQMPHQLLGVAYALHVEKCEPADPFS